MVASHLLRFMTPKEKLLLAIKKGYSVTNEGVLLNKFGQPVKGRLNHHGYRQFGMKTGEGRKQCNVAVHRIMAFQKFGHRIFDPLLCVRHLDGNPLNNSAANIEIGTYSQNMMDIPKEVRVRKAGLAALKHPRAAIKEFYNSCHSYKLTMAEFGLTSKGTLNHILRH